ncbi:MAG TPA: hypothetical protein PLE81_12185 [Brevundimonas sp.]|jgi:hypothetical protein|uniref:hypothetical protein n=1 Tax=Brevundimonas sp. TaxID=1871086 RepID=UPI002CF503F1|nr:hypothetical protein [Brevundimonas sp.]HRH21381.1 hypothetical protein [Brevundimonas sp.]
MRLIAFAVALAALATPAQAQITITEAEPATAEQIAAARAEADRLIAAAEASAFFDNVSEGAEPRTRHRLSGLVCRFVAGDSSNQVVVFPSPLPRGDDVGCNVGSGDHYRTIYATRFGQYNISPEQALEIGVAGIVQRFADARPYDQAITTASTEGATPTQIRAFWLGNGYTHVLVAHIGDWSIKERLTWPEAPTSQQQLSNALIWVRALRDVVQFQGD